MTTNVLKLAAEQRERGHTDTIAIAAAEMIERVLTELEKAGHSITCKQNSWVYTPEAWIRSDCTCPMRLRKVLRES